MLRSQSIRFYRRSKAIGGMAEKGCTEFNIWKGEDY